jgi:hypothetical protein
MCFIALAGQAQLINTKWETTLQLENQTTVSFEFKKDTLKAISTADGSVIETMTYTVQDSSLKVKRVMGESSCDNGTIGIYYFKITAKQLSLTLADDVCTDRSSALNHTVWTKIDK